MVTAAKQEKLFRLLKQLPSTTRPPLFLRLLSVQVDPPSSSPPPTTTLTDNAGAVTQIIELLQSSKVDTWNKENLLRRILSSSTSPLTPLHIFRVIRQLGDSQKALKLFELIQKVPSLSPLPSLLYPYQAIFELASREPNSPIKLSELLRTSRAHGIPLTVDSASLLIRCFGRAQMVPESIQVFNELDPSLRKTHLCNILLDVLFKSERIDDALHVLDDMLEPNSECLPDDITGSIVFSAFLKRSQPDGIEREDKLIGLISKLGEHGVFPDAMRLTQLITKLSRACNTNRAWDVLHVVMKMGGPVEVPSCNSLLTGLGRDRDFQRMNLLLTEMKELGIHPNVVTYGILINQLCKWQRVDDALQVFKKMTMKGDNDSVVIQPDVIAFNTIINGLCKVGRQDEGLGLVDQMGSQHGCSPNTVTYNCLIDGFCKAGEIDKSQELFARMNEEGISPNVITLNTLVDGMCKHGKLSFALEFFHDMQRKGLKGNAVTYTALISAFCNVNNIDKAMELFEEMVKARCSPDSIVYYALISGLSRAGRMDDACSVASNMQEAGFCLDAVSFNILISGFCKKNKLDKAYTILNEMEEAGIQPDEVTYNTLIATASKAGDFATAHRVMRKMVDECLVPTVVTYGTLIHGYCRAGNLSEAMDIFRDMCSASKIPPNTVIYNILIDSLCNEKEIETAVSLMDEMQVKGVLPNTTTYNAMFKGLQAKNWLEKAFELMDRMNEQACNPDYVTMEILTEWLSAVGETAKLRSFVQGYEVSVSSM